MPLGQGAGVNTQGGEYGNALEAASYEGHVEVVKLVLDNGADVNAGMDVMATHCEGYHREAILMC